MYILCIQDLLNFFLSFWVFLGHEVYQCFFKLSQISKTFSSIFMEQYSRISGTVKFKPVPFMGQHDLQITKRWILCTFHYE